MNRRGFLSSCLALAAAPAIVRADSLMRIVPKHVALYVPEQNVVLLIPTTVVSTLEVFCGIGMEQELCIRESIKRSVRRYGKVSDLTVVTDRFSRGRANVLWARASFNAQREIVRDGDAE